MESSQLRSVGSDQTNSCRSVVCQQWLFEVIEDLKLLEKNTNASLIFKGTFRKLHVIEHISPLVTYIFRNLVLYTKINI